MRQLWNFNDLSTSEMYDRTQTDDKIKSGDLFVCNDKKTVGFLSEAWPVCLFGEVGVLHAITKGMEAKILATDNPGVEEQATMVAETLGIGHLRTFIPGSRPVIPTLEDMQLKRLEEKFDSSERRLAEESFDLYWRDLRDLKPEGEGEPGRLLRLARESFIAGWNAGR